MMNIELSVAEDLEMHVDEGAETVFLVVIVAVERWRNRLQSELRCCIWNSNVTGNMREDT